MTFKVCVLIGSHRVNSNSARLAEVITSKIASSSPHVNTWSLDLGKNPLPMWDEGVWSGSDSWKQAWGPISQRLQESDGLISIVPEYGGMVPAAVKNFFMLCSSKELGHKPGLIASVSSGRGGSYPVVELRSSSYKNTRIVWLPDHFILRDADQALLNPSKTPDADLHNHKNLDYSLKVFCSYLSAMKTVRESGVLDYKNHPFGM